MGPFPVAIFWSKLNNMIDDGKFVEADRGYRREQIQVRLPVDYKTVL